MSAPVNNKLVCLLGGFHIAVIALANYTVQFTGTFAGHHFTWGMFVFPLVILATDLTVRLCGAASARRIVAIAYLPAILISAVLADWRIGIASGTAYLCGQWLDIAAFRRIRERSRRWWPAPLVSTFCANLLDTYLFYSVAFYRAADPHLAAHWVELATVDLGFKVVVGAVMFLPIYGVLLRFLMRRRARRDSQKHLTNRRR